MMQPVSRLVIFTLMIAGLAACATTAALTIEDRLVEIGIPADKADCMADQLKERLETEDLQDLADYMSGLARSASAGEALDELLEIRNPRAVGTITQSGISCLFAPTR